MGSSAVDFIDHVSNKFSARSRYRASPESASASKYTRTSCSASAESRGSLAAPLEDSRCRTSAVGRSARTTESSAGIVPAIARLGGPSASDTTIAKHLTALAQSAGQSGLRREY